MKRLLLGPALIAPLALFGCNWGPKVPERPKVPEVVRQIPLDDFDHFPPITAPQIPVAPKAPVVKHKPHQVKKHVRPAPARRPHVEAVEAPPAPEALPPQQGPICIFPLSMIPNCTPQAAGQ
jgi:hypothetical protein